MTLGPTIALLPLAERAHGRIADMLATFGRVPMFYYLLHIPTIHIAALLVALVRERQVHPEVVRFRAIHLRATGLSMKPPAPGMLCSLSSSLRSILVPAAGWTGVKAQRESGWIRLHLVRPFTAFGVAEA